MAGQVGQDQIYNIMNISEQWKIFHQPDTTEVVQKCNTKSAKPL